MNAHYQRKEFTTDADGNATVYSGTVEGRLFGVRYNSGDTASGGITIAITSEDSGQALATFGAGVAPDGSWVYPRAAVQKASASGTDFTNGFDYLFLLDERIKIVIGAGGDTKTGSIDLLTEG